MLPLLFMKYFADKAKREEAERAYNEKLEQTQASVRTMMKIIVWLVVTAGSGIIFVGLLHEPIITSILIAAVLGLICASLAFFFEGPLFLIFPIIHLALAGVSVYLCFRFNLCTLPLPLITLINFVILLIISFLVFTSIGWLISILVATAAGMFLFSKFQTDGISLLTLGYMAFAISVVFMLNFVPVVKKSFSQIGYTVLLLALSLAASFLMIKIFKVPLSSSVIIMISVVFFGLVLSFIQARQGNYV